MVRVGVTWSGAGQGRPFGHSQVSRSLERCQEPFDGCASEGSCSRFGSALFAMPLSSAVDGHRVPVPAESGCLGKALQGLVGCCESNVALK